MPEKPQQPDNLETEIAESAETVVNLTELGKQEKERNYQKNLTTLLVQVQELLDAVSLAEGKKESTREVLEKEIVFEVPKAHTLKDIEEKMDKHKRMLKGLSQTLKKVSLRTKGVKNPEQVLPLLYYLETEIKNRVFDRVVTTSEKAPKITAQWKKRGYEVEIDENYLVKGKVLLRLEKEVPYIPSKETLRRLGELLGEANDPVETITRLKQMGFRIEGETVEHRFDKLKEFVVSQDILETMKLLQSVGLRNKYREYLMGFGGDSMYGDTPDKRIRELAKDEEARALFVPEALKKTLNYYNHIAPERERDVSLEELDVFERRLKFFSDRESEALFIFLSDYQRNEMRFVWGILATWEEAGIKKEFSQILQRDAYAASIVYERIKRVSSYPDDTYAQRLNEAFQEATSSPVFKKLAEDKQAAEFIKNIIQISGVNNIGRITDEAKVIRGIDQLKGKPEALAACQLITQGSFYYHVDPSLDSQLGDILKIVEDKELLEELVHPRFQQFIKDLREKLGVYIIESYFYEIRNKYGNFYDLYRSDIFIESLRSEKFVTLLKRQERHRFNPITFRKLAEIPDVVDKVENFERTFDITIQPSHIDILPQLLSSSYFEQSLQPKTVEFYKKLHDAYSYTIEVSERSIEQLCSSVDKEQEIFSHDAKAFYTDVHKIFDYNLNLAELPQLLSFKGNNDLKEKIFANDNVAFIKRVGEVKELSDIETFTNLPENRRKVVERLHQDFNYRFRAREVHEDRYPYSIIPRIGFDKGIEEDIEQGNEISYKTRAAQEICLGFLYEGDPAHDYLEYIKENQWITIQTYNRLYAARRSHIGFDSYAYIPQEGESHPIINTTFYGNSLRDILYRKRDDLHVDKVADNEGFYPGSIGGTAIRIYPETYQLYADTLKAYFEKGEKLDIIPAQFSWFPSRKISTKTDNEQILNQALPLGVALNGHTHYYATPYGIISGCVSVPPKMSGIFEDEHIAARAVGVITGHREMLQDFFKRQEEKESKENKNYQETTSANGITINISETDIPKELESMILPGNITLREVLLNLQIEQYLQHIHRNAQLIQKLIKEVEADDVEVFLENKKLSLTDSIPGGSKIIMKFKEKSQQIAA